VNLVVAPAVSSTSVGPYVSPAIHTSATGAEANVASAAMHISATRAEAKAPWAVPTRTHDTFNDMTQQTSPLPVPGYSASKQEKMSFVQHQLESLAGREEYSTA
jgi:hypothetical protein